MNRATRLTSSCRYLLIAGMLLADSAAHARQVRFIRGDSNQDGRVDLADVIATLRVFFASTDERARTRELVKSCWDAADANDDGRVDMADPVFTLGHLFLFNEAMLPTPYPDPGADPTVDDELTCWPSDSELPICAWTGLDDYSASRVTLIGWEAFDTEEAAWLFVLTHFSRMRLEPEACALGRPEYGDPRAFDTSLSEHCDERGDADLVCRYGISFRVFVECFLDYLEEFLVDYNERHPEAPLWAQCG